MFESIFSEYSGKPSYKLLPQNETNKIIESDEMTDINLSTMDISSYSELVGSKKRRPYKKYLLISLIFLIIIGILVVVVVYVTKDPPSDDTTTTSSSSTVTPAPTNPPVASAITLEDILDNKLYARRNNATWISDTELLYRNANDDLVKYNVATKALKIVLGIQESILAQAFRYTLSPDQRYLMIESNPLKIYRHSTESNYDVVDLESTGFNVYSVQATSLNGTVNSRLLLAEWAPTGSSIVFVANDRNIYYKQSVTSAPITITDDGGPVIFNGVCDWVYEEEVFSSKTALWFSPDGTKLAYVQFNDTEVQVMHLQIYGPPGSIQYQYVHLVPMHYPKVGTRNPTVKLYSVNLSGLTVGQPVPKNEISAPEPVRDVENIVTSVAWQNNDTVISVWMNRVQNQAYLQSCVNSNCNLFKSITSPDGWVELYNAITVKDDGTQFAIIASQSQGDAGGYRHITLLTTSNANEVVVTSGRYVVTGILHWDAPSNIIFYSANQESQSEIQHIYAIKALAGETPQCLTCNIVIDGVPQTYFSAEFSKTGNSFVLSREGPSLPSVDVYVWQVDANSVVTIQTQVEWDRNEEVKQILADVSTPTIRHLTVELSHGFSAKVKLQLPPGADLSGRIKYPMLVYVYAGPDSYNGYDKWEMDYGSYLASNKSIIYAHINGRGSGNRGDKLLNQIYRKFGTVEVDDQIETAKKLPDVLNYIDREKVAIWGWSYGGYAAGMALAKDTEGVFKCAASVAPVTDWTYYDSIYTERYMGLPGADNGEGYNESRLSTLAESFRGKNYYLIHGTLDDNVHYQQSMALARSLEQKDILFKQMSYPDEDHSLWGVRAHLYHSLGRFFAECFHLDKDL
ncbi:venom dipeptidyl peptidase 4 isoform X1 [Bradysia coprophila]|uniref:venom dipeptidyl peptidase 4 isoform X1 n=1 Tax=Bradysia coprophila TaxID=38358 RepID=UPI00187DBB03|nr:venom dipeptidyl peptidase 4 isoform X1 [Bradysia coprophila]